MTCGYSDCQNLKCYVWLFSQKRRSDTELQRSPKVTYGRLFFFRKGIGVSAHVLITIARSRTKFLVHPCQRQLADVGKGVQASIKYRNHANCAE